MVLSLTEKLTKYLDRPLWPFLLVFLLPIMTVPIALAIISSLPSCPHDRPTWELRHVQMAFLPGLVDLLPFLWLTSPTARVKWAAVVAGLIGAARIAFPQVIMATSEPVPVRQGTADNPHQINCAISFGLSSRSDLTWLIPAILIFWLVSTLLGVAILHWMTR